MPDCKPCRKCGDEKPLADFYAHRRMSDGRLNVCKECVKTRVRDYYRRTVDERRAYERRRTAEPERREFLSAACRKHREKYPDRYRARQAVSNAVRDGRLRRRPCEECGSADAQAHHHDYSKPLDVRWLCKLHHDLEHGTSVDTPNGRTL